MTAMLALTAGAKPTAGTLRGTVLGRIDIPPRYSFMRLRTASGNEWAAVPVSTVSVGEEVVVENAFPMVGFKSKELGITFDRVSFGALSAGSPRTDPSIEPEVGRVRGREECFDYASIDLNGDGEPEILVLSRDQEWCGSGGCTLFIYRRSSNALAEVASVGLVGEALIADKRINGWKSLVIENRSGLWLLTFDGKTYPSNPTTRPATRLAKRPAASPIKWTRASTCR